MAPLFWISALAFKASVGLLPSLCNSLHAIDSSCLLLLLNLLASISTLSKEQKILPFFCNVRKFYYRHLCENFFFSFWSFWDKLVIVPNIWLQILISDTKEIWPTWRYFNKYVYLKLFISVTFPQNKIIKIKFLMDIHYKTWAAFSDHTRIFCSLLRVISIYIFDTSRFFKQWWGSNPFHG